jgi:hypothetical protein
VRSETEDPPCRAKENAGVFVKAWNLAVAPTFLVAAIVVPERTVVRRVHPLEPTIRAIPARAFPPTSHPR